MSEGTDSEQTVHVAVMQREVIEGIMAERGGEFLDCTAGGGGHTSGILAAHPKNRVVAFDRDKRAIERLNRFLDHERVELVHGNFAKAKSYVRGRLFDGVLVDCGMSTDQLRGGRGFSYLEPDAPLDMRMNADEESPEMTAAELLNTATEGEIRILLKEGGVGADAGRLARAIVRGRPLHYVRDLLRCIDTVPRAKPDRNRGGRRSPSGPAREEKRGGNAAVVFQAIRMAVNQERESLIELLESVPDVVRNGARLVVLSFHSGEDTIVTKRLRAWAAGCTCPPMARCQCGGAVKRGALLTKKATLPTEEESLRNPPSRSARMRVFEFRSVDSHVKSRTTT